jgi:hypothetical protein
MEKTQIHYCIRDPETNEPQILMVDYFTHVPRIGETVLLPNLGRLYLAKVEEICTHVPHRFVAVLLKILNEVEN